MDFLGAFTRWDAGAYLDIAQSGYVGAGRESLAAYWPLYPLLVRAGTTLLGGSETAFAVSGVLVANAALLIALAGLYALARPRIGNDRALLAVTYLLIYPTTIFLSAAYAESAFLAFAVMSAHQAERSHWLRSAVLAALAALTRPFGALAVLPLIFAARRSRSAGPRMFAIALAPLAFLAWAAYLGSISGDPLDVVHVYAAWGSAARSPIATVADLFDPSVYGFPWFVFGLFVLFAALAVESWRRWGWGFGAYGAAVLLVVAASGSLTSSMRYELAMFPAFVALAALTDRAALRIAWTIVSTSVALLFAGMFALYYWIG